MRVFVHAEGCADKQTEMSHVTIFAVIVSLTEVLGTMEGVRVKVSMQTHT